MKCIEFSETREERKYYEDKKQDALRYLDHTIEKFDKVFPLSIHNEQFFKTSTLPIHHLRNKLKELKKRVNDI